MRKIVIASAKGGTAKSTTATCLAVGLARRGMKTLIVDCDGQANATFSIMGGAEVEGPTLAEVLLRDASADEAIRPTPIENLEILPAGASLNGANVSLVQEIGRDVRLRAAMSSVEGQWDFVILDTAPAFSTILANAMVFGSEVIVPIDCGMFAMLGLVQLTTTIDEVRDAYGNTALHLAGLLLTRVSKNNVHRDVEAGLRERFAELVFRSIIPNSIQVEAAHTRGQTVVDFAPKSPAAIAYQELVSEVIEHGSGKKVGAGGLASGVLERLAQPKPTIEPEDVEQSVEQEPARGRGPAKPKPLKKVRTVAGSTAPVPVKGRTIYLPEVLFERILIQAHRKGLTISDYCTNILNRHVPDYRASQVDQAAGEEAA